MRALNTAALARLAAIGVLAAAVLASVTMVHAPSLEPGRRVSSAPTDRELDRCRTLGMAADNDPRCRAAWRALRDHFLHLSKSPAP